MIRKTHNKVMDYSQIKIDFEIEKANPADLLMKENFESVKYVAYEFIENLEWDGMLKFAEALDDKISTFAPQNEEQKFFHEVLKYWVLRLRTFAFESLSKGDKKQLLEKYLVEILKMGLDIKRSVFKFLDIFDSPEIIKVETTDFVFALNNNQEHIGEPKNFQRQQFKPTVANWVREYQTTLASLNKGTELQAGSFHILKFIDSNPFVRNLEPVEKEILKLLLDFYNFLLTPITYIDIKSPEAAGNSLVPYMSEQKLTLPPTVQTGVSAVQPPAKPLNIQEMMSKKPAAVVPPPLKMQKPQGKAFSLPQSSGISFGGGNVSVEKEAEINANDAKLDAKNAKNSSDTAKIDRKLEELKNKIKNANDAK